MTLSQPKLQNILKILGNEVTRTSDKDNTEQYYLQPYVTLWERFMLLKNTHLITGQYCHTLVTVIRDHLSSQ